MKKDETQFKKAFIAAKDADSQEFQRKTTKYWVHAQDIPEMKRIILEQMPEYVFSSKITNLIQSLYLDNDELRQYQDRMMLVHRGAIFRYRWYGNGVPSVGFMEQKIRKLGFRSLPDEKSVKRRFKLKPELLMQYLSGDYVPTADNTDPPLDPESVALAAEMQAMILTRKLKPTIRTAYNRSCYQGSFDAPIRVSFDENLQLSVCRDNEAFIGDPKDLLPRLDPLEVYDFPHGVLEIKVRLSGTGASYLPPWAQAMVDRGIIVAGDKFSKFNAAVALLLNDRVDKIPYFFPLIEEFGPAPPPELSVGVAKDANKLNYRRYLNNERLVLKWLRTAMFFGVFGVALLEFDLSLAFGCTFVITACLLAIRALYMFHLRLRVLVHKEGGMVYEQYSPLVMVAVLVIGLLLQSYSKNNNSFFTRASDTPSPTSAPPN